MPPRSRPRFWRICRVYFRRVRLTVWLLTLTLLTAVIYLNQVGLPGFIKKPLLDKLRARGLELQFSRLRLRWYGGIVAENVRFGPADALAGPQLTLAEVQVWLNLRALARLQLQIDSLTLRHGRLLLPLTQTNLPNPHLAVDKIQSDLRFLPNDLWALDNFHASFAGAQLRLSGMVTNASAARDWRLFHGHPAAAERGPSWSQRLQHLADILQTIHFSAPPELRLDMRGDARDLQSFGVLMLLSAPGAETPWGTVADGHFTGRLYPLDTNGLLRANMSVEAASAQTRWGALTNFSLALQLSSQDKQPGLVHGQLNLFSPELQTQWGSGRDLLFTARWLHALTNPIPISGQGELRCHATQSRWGSARDFLLSGSLSPPVAPVAADPSWAWWTNLQPYQLDWRCLARDFQSPDLLFDELTCTGHWAAPQLSISNLQVKLDTGQLSAAAELNVLTRLVSARLASDFDLREIGPILGEPARQWLGQFAWSTPPLLSAQVALTVPAWTDARPDWRAQIQPTVRLAGEFVLPQSASFRQIQVSSARSHFLYSNLCWHLPDLQLSRPEGTIAAEHRANEQTKDFYWHILSHADLTALRPVLGAGEQQFLNLFQFNQPPALDLELWGRSQDPDRTGARAQVALTNFSFRGQAISWLTTRLDFTNKLLRFYQPRVQCASGAASADGLAADLNARLVFLTNGLSTLPPLTIATAIGPDIARAIEPYQFLQPPSARVYGTIPLVGEAGADLHFDLEGGPFRWWRFNTSHIQGHVHWTGQQVELSHVQLNLYGGAAKGSAAFDFSPRNATLFRFGLETTNTQLHALMTDLAGTNQLEGKLSAHLSITHASTADWRSVNGSGDLDLSDGLIWDIPLFGIFSPVLNGIVPGLGNSRATAATCTFLLTNGVLWSHDLEIRSPAMRLQYRGTVGLDQQLNARVEAELFRDMRVVGPLVSTVFWPVTKMFEYKVSGQLAQPKMEPVFIIPKLILFPFHPLKSIKGLFNDESDSPENFAPIPP